ncbi:MAG: hypothetical protein RLZZ244_297 [Verrucomicrobiota bacterium]
MFQTTFPSFTKKDIRLAMPLKKGTPNPAATLPSESATSVKGS